MMNGKESTPLRAAPRSTSVLSSPLARRMFVLRMLRERALATPRAPAEKKSA